MSSEASFKETMHVIPICLKIVRSYSRLAGGFPLIESRDGRRRKKESK